MIPDSTDIALSSLRSMHYFKRNRKGFAVRMQTGNGSNYRIVESNVATSAFTVTITGLEFGIASAPSSWEEKAFRR
ncbi:hypothetical protein GCM10023188_35420 [Pontibacter saemangeumensis]|uniref:Uncharacterized protein n=1 Tax=Pontibacter saemangeumensis TaxID=1084525 RepID=A0ABP8M0Q9_9BACT